MARYRSKVANFYLRHLCLAHRLAWPRWIFAEIYDNRKPSAISNYGVVCEILCLAVLVQYLPACDGRTDRHTTTAYTALA